MKSASGPASHHRRRRPRDAAREQAAEFGRGDEVAADAELGLAGAVIAEAGRVQGQFHEAPERDGTVGADVGADQVGQSALWASSSALGAGNGLVSRWGSKRISGWTPTTRGITHNRRPNGRGAYPMTDSSRPVVVITGAAKRVGAVMAEAFCEAGYDLAISYRHSRAEAEAVAARCEAKRAQSCMACRWTWPTPSALAPFIERVAAHYGRIDALINNASSFFPTPVAPRTKRNGTTVRRECEGAVLPGPGGGAASGAGRAAASST
jgi:hypothetical protein